MAEEKKESNVDVLILGAGPAGLLSATWMAHLGLNARIVDKRSAKVFAGQADGLQPRTMEIFDSFRVVNDIEYEALLFNDMASWSLNDDGKLVRKDRFGEMYTGMSRFHEYVLNQGYIEKFLLEGISSHSDIAVERGVLPSSLSIDKEKAEDPDSYPVTVNLKHLSEEDAIPTQCKAHEKNDEVRNGLFRSNLTGDDSSYLIDQAVAKDSYSEVVHAKYVIGCDGAHSWTREQLGIDMEGEATDYIWGVIDVIPITDFPDARRPATLQSNSGSMLIIPREKKLVRFYVQLQETKPDQPGGDVDRSKITPESILEAARKILDPYTLDYSYCDWWTAYQVGQRVGRHFNEPCARVFLAGDAVHTHSPKEGQGMNISMQDAFNLGWKIGGAAKGWLPRNVLRTYEPERRPLAQELIAFDHKLSRVFSGSPTDKELHDLYNRNMTFMLGFGIKYGPSLLVAAAKSPSDEDEIDPLYDQSGKVLQQAPTKARTEYAEKVRLGRVFGNSIVYGQADTRFWNFQHALQSDGRWRLIVFAGDVSSKDRMQKITDLGERLTKSGGLLDQHMTTFFTHGSKGDKKRRSLIDVLLIHTANISDVEITDFNKAYLPFDEAEGYEYDKIFADNETKRPGSGKAYEEYGVDPDKGAMVVARPDQYVAFVTGLDFVNEVEEFFDGVLLKQGTEGDSHVVNGKNGKL